MSSRACLLCGSNWPDETLYEECPKCLITTTRTPQVTAMPIGDAARLRNCWLGWHKYDREHPEAA